MTTLMDSWALPAAIPLPAVLAGGAGVVIATAAALSNRTAHRPDLPAQRWSRPLPVALSRVADATRARLVLGLVGLLAAVAGIVALARRDAPADGMAAVTGLTALAMVAGPCYALFDPVEALSRLRHGGRATDDGDAGLRPSAAWLFAFCLVALATRSPLALAVAAGVLLLQGLGPWGARHDPARALVRIVGHLAPLGRDADGRLAWRNPLVAVTHAELPHGAVAFGGVVVAAGLAHAAAGRLGLTGVPAALALVMTAALVGGVLRLAIIRPFFRSGIVPVVAAYGLVAAGRWAPPLDLVVFVALHALAVAVLHRQAVARHDLRTARAVLFPPRVALVVSVLGGLTALAG